MKKIKELTSTPKKLALFVACTIFAVGILTVGSFFAVYAVVDNQSIGKNKALEIALADAGCSKDQVTVKKTELSYDDGMFEYDVEFYADGMEYSYTVKASNGVILSTDTDGIKIPVETNSQTKSDNQPTKLNSLGSAEAKAIALKDADIAENEAMLVKTELDEDDGKLHYDVEFVSGDTKYEYEIDAVSGQILKRESKLLESGDKPSDDKNSNTSSVQLTESRISIEEAKNIALKDAGVSANEVRFTKTKLEQDDGILKYEIEFIKGDYEYEYEINAANGAVLEHDVDEAD